MPIISQKDFLKGGKPTLVQPASRALAEATTQPTQSPSYLKRVKDSISTDLNKRVDKVSEIKSRDTNVVEKGAQIFGQGAGLAANAFEKTVGEVPGIKQGLQKFSEGINWLSNTALIKNIGDTVGKSKTLQEIVTLYDTDSNFKDTVDGVSNIVRLYGDAAIANDAATFVKNTANKLLTASQRSVTVGGRKLTLDQIHSAEGTKFIESLPTEQRAIISNFDKLHSAKDALNRAIKMKAPADDINLLKEVYVNELKSYQTAIKGSEAVPGLFPKSVSTTAKSVKSDLFPGSSRIINSEVTRALDLTPGDVKNISLSTKNEVGQFLADKNLIGSNVNETVKAIDDFYKKNYDAVREEIGKITATYDPVEVPRYKEALTALKSKVQDTPGLQSANYEIDQLLRRERPSLGDVQKVKELMDEHLSLYKNTGDVKEGVAKQGLAEIRQDIRKWIEDEVKERGGADIGELNNNVQTSRSISEAIEARSTKGLTKANVSTGDIMTFLVGSAAGTPLLGAASVLVKKLYQSPTLKLKVSKWLDTLSDARKAKIMQDLEKGVLPKEIKISQKSYGSPDKNASSLSANRNGQDTMLNNVIKNDSIDQNIKVNIANASAPITKTSKRTIPSSLSQKKGIVKRLVDKYKEIPNKQGGFVRIGKKEIREIPEATKKEMITLADYLNLKKDINPKLEDALSKIQLKYGINPDWSSNKIADTLVKLIENTKTK